MKILSILTFTMLLLNSCASILNSEIQKVIINHDPSLNVRIDTSFYYYHNKEIYNVYIPKNYLKSNFYFLRCDSPIPLIINNSDTLHIKPHRSYFSYWFANIYSTGGLGMIIDYPNDKSFQYPIYNYIEKNDDKIQNVRFKPIPENSFKFTLNIPAVNMFYLQTDSGKRSTASAMGISGGVEYFLKNNYYLSFNLGVTLNLFTPFRDSVYLQTHYYYYPHGFYEYSSTNYINFRINKITPKLEYGIGLTLSNLKWSSNNIIESTDSTLKFNQSYHKSFNLGFSSAVKFRLTPYINIGFLYQPLFYDFSNNKYFYQHFITSQIIWRF
ncbi:MAG: hypothetical protein MUO72_05975 [Bacteroidales bacterium]|nr:hypothetical protein [Bacteroidales bacterium]